MCKMENSSSSGANDLNEMDFGSDFGSDIEAEDERPGTPEELVNAADNASKDLLPEKSKGRYQQVFDNFQKWKASKSAPSNSESVVLSYFSELAEKSSPSTLWARYSMLKATMKIYDNIDISKYVSVVAFLKKKFKKHVPKKAKILTEGQLRQFIEIAPDVAWLDVKVACIFAIFGACRSNELWNIRMADIARYPDMYYIHVPETKTGGPNGFAVTQPLLDVVRSYEDLRPSRAETDRFFLNFQRGKCTTQVMGKNKFYKMPHRIAQFLKLPDASLYTGHTFRRSSATLYANTGASIEALKRHTGHRSSKVCEGYIEDSLGYKKQRGEAIMGAISNASSDKASSMSVPSTAQATVSAGSDNRLSANTASFVPPHSFPDNTMKGTSSTSTNCVDFVSTDHTGSLSAGTTSFETPDSLRRTVLERTSSSSRVEAAVPVGSNTDRLSDGTTVFVPAHSSRETATEGNRSINQATSTVVSTSIEMGTITDKHATDDRKMENTDEHDVEESATTG